MNISYNWLKKYIAADLSAEAMATILTDIGLEVESFEKIETVRGGLQGVVVGEVLTCEKHPDSDHLHVTTVDVGAPEPLRIVCGAPNCRKGLKVLCATVGAVLYPEGGDEAFKIKRGDRIAQLMIIAVEQPEFEVVETLSETERGAGGFGSSGVSN